MKIVFMGTPDFAAASLQNLLDWQKGEVIAVYCQPDRPAGRGHSLRTGPVKKLALTHKRPIFQPVNFKEQSTLDELAALKADIFVVAAYGLLLPQSLLDIPHFGAINVHASLLPKYRGAAPIQRAVMNGDNATGITIMQMEKTLDTGPILLQRALGIGIDQTAGEIHDELADLGGRLLIDALERLQAGKIVPVPQNSNLSSYAAKLDKTDGILVFNKSAREVHNQARGVTPWPGAQLTISRASLDGKKLEPLKIIIELGMVFSENTEHKIPGQVLSLKDGILPITCSAGIYGISRLRPAGGKSMSAEAFSNGYLKNCFTSIVECPA